MSKCPAAPSESGGRVLITRSRRAGIANVVRQFLRWEVHHSDPALGQPHEERSAVDARQLSGLARGDPLHLEQFYRHGEASLLFKLSRSLMQGVRQGRRVFNA